MSYIDVLTAVLLAMLSLLTVACTVRAVRFRMGEERRRMLAVSRRTICDGVDGAGISVISVGASETESVSRLLSSEYERFEVIVVTDSSRDGDFVGRLVSDFALVRVDYRPADLLGGQSAVRALYRSRRRRFKRLTVADAVSEGFAADADAAVGIAVCDYVGAVRSDTVLIAGAVERLAAEICSSVQPPHEIASTAGDGFRLFLRDDVVAGGGFASGASHFCRRTLRRHIDEPLTLDCGCRHRCLRSFAVLLAVTAAFGIGVSVAGRTLWPAVAVAASWMTVVSAVLFGMQFCAPSFGGGRKFVRTLGNFCDKLC